MAKLKHTEELEHVLVRLMKKGIDPDIFPLILLLNYLGLKTVQSSGGSLTTGTCYPWIRFRNVRSKFLSIEMPGGNELTAIQMVLHNVYSFKLSQGSTLTVIPEKKRNTFLLVPDYEYVTTGLLNRVSQKRKRECLFGGRRKMNDFCDFLIRLYLSNTK